jgi:alpha-beta hydrolase superfamily lysophospholipase
MPTNAQTSASGLKTFTFQPSGAVRGTAILIHGHGDYSSRYESILEPFLEQGICCVSTDLPGHGESPGKRGFIEGLHAIDDLVQESHSRARAICPDGPLGLIGHSVGGLLALRELLHQRDRYQFAWVSSPLLRPDSTRHPFVVAILRILGPLFPNIALNTGVSSGDCRHFENPEEEQTWDDGLFHRQINLGWGLALLHAAEEIAHGFSESAPELPILFTQGTADPVCDAKFLRAFLSANQFSQATHLEFKDQLHEPFADSAQEEVRSAIERWLERSLSPRSA